MLITRKAAHIKVFSELHDSMNWKNCRSFRNLQIWSKNSDFDRENLILQFCPALGFNSHRSFFWYFYFFSHIFLSDSCLLEHGNRRNIVNLWWTDRTCRRREDKWFEYWSMKGILRLMRHLRINLRIRLYWAAALHERAYTFIAFPTT